MCGFVFCYSNIVLSGTWICSAFEILALDGYKHYYRYSAINKYDNILGKLLKNEY